MNNVLLPYYCADNLHAIKCMKDLADVSPSHPNIERYVNDSINCLRFFPTLKIAEDWFIVRMRIGWHEDEEEQYSYPHDKEIVRLGRANLPKDPMFYGSITNDSNNVFESSRISAMEIADKALEHGHCRVHITMSCWRTKHPLLVFPVIHSSLYSDLLEENNLLVSKLRNAYEKNREKWTLEQNIDKPTLLTNDNIYKYWSEEFQRKITDGSYYKTAYFTKIMMNEQHKWSKERKTYDGILYPSHKTYGRIGCNLAIRPDVVDAQLELMIKGRGTLYVNQQSTKTKYLIQFESYKFNQKGKWVKKNVRIPEDELCDELCLKSIEELEWIE